MQFKNDLCFIFVIIFPEPFLENFLGEGGKLACSDKMGVADD